MISDVGDIYYERLVLPSVRDRFWADDGLLRLLKQSALKIYLEARAPPPVDLLSQYAITLVYVDPDGDKIYIGSGIDLMNAVIPYRCDMDESYCPPDNTLAAKFLAKVRPISMAESGPTPPSAVSVAAGTQTAPTPTVRPPPSVEDVIEAVMGIVGPAVRLSVQAVERAASQVTEAHAAAAAAAAQAAAAASKPSSRTIFGNANASPPTATTAATTTPETGRPFIHMSHTCDECLTCPIVGERYHCLDKDDYDLCQSCYSKYDWPLRFKPVKLGTLAPIYFPAPNNMMKLPSPQLASPLLRSRRRPPGACAEAT
jgi:Zinc finger, ZZ type